MIISMIRVSFVILLVLMYSYVIKSSELCEMNLSNVHFVDINSFVFKLRECVTPNSNKGLKLVLKNCNLLAFPNNTFSNFKKLQRLELVIEDNSEVQHLLPPLPGFTLFDASWFDSVVIRIQDVLTLGGWRWAHLADLKVNSTGGLDFNAIRSKLVYLHSDFSKIAEGNVIAVRILKCQLRWLGKEVFAPFKLIKTLELRDNLLENIERSHLPISAPNLRTLDLGNNRLKTLPEDFTNGLNLQLVFLQGNNLKIPAHQVELISNAKEYPHLFGVLWPCICKESTMASTDSTMDKMSYCYKEGDTGKPLNYHEVCS